MDIRLFTDAARHAIERLWNDGHNLKLFLASLMIIANATGAAWARVPHLYRIAIFLLALDWITGLARAFLTKTNNSRSAKEGIVKMAIYLIFLILSDLAALLCGTALGWLPVLAFSAVAHSETTSNLENLRDISEHFGVKIPVLQVAIDLLRLKNKAQIEALIKGATAPLNEEKEEGE